MEELKVMAQSPSSLKLFQTCPKQYKARYIDKTIKASSSPAMERGSAIHACMEAEVLGRPAAWPPGEEKVRDYGRSVLKDVLLLDQVNAPRSRWQVATEFSLAMDRAGDSTEWFSPSGYLRSRTDLVIIPPAGIKLGIIVDWKTGRSPGEAQQLLINAVCMTANYGPRRYECCFVYLDQRRVETFSFDIDADLPQSKNPEMEKLRYELNLLEHSHMIDSFPARRGPACRWCQLAAACS
jgi:RecB family exonuclease